VIFARSLHAAAKITGAAQRGSIIVMS